VAPELLSIAAVLGWHTPCTRPRPGAALSESCFRARGRQPMVWRGELSSGSIRFALAHYTEETQMTRSPVLDLSSHSLLNDTPEAVREEPQATIPDQDRPREVETPRPGRETSVLVVDDDAGIRTVLADALRAAGYRVSLASDGFAALNLVRRDSPDVVILDLGLPVLDGQEFLDAWRTVTPSLRIPVVILSGAEVPTSLANFGVHCHISKPFDVDQILAAVASATAGERV
jgi:two-component system, response regulator, stage 0 sporulation protein F